MIIVCINCNRKFVVNSELIPTEGRNIQCGSCNHIWFFKPDRIQKKIPEKLTNIDQDIELFKDDKFINNKIENKKEKKIDYNKIKKYQLTKYNKKSNFTFTKFLSYLIVSIISFIAFIVIIDTFKKPLYSNFPALELVMFSLFETLVDIKLFIKDLF
tara:strand:+ start:77 stop:547 length:471 start_codon:yes stop_codon:yes gene_type:complete